MDDNVHNSQVPLEDDVRSPNVFERPHEAMLSGTEPGSGGETVEPWEEGPVTQGFQNGGWDYDASRDVPQQGIPDVDTEHEVDRSDRT